MDIEVKTISRLTASQQAVMGRLVFFGETNAEIAKALVLSEKTVKAHMTAIYQTLGCKNCRQLLVRYFRGPPETTKPQSETEA